MDSSSRLAPDHDKPLVDSSGSLLSKDKIQDLDGIEEIFRCYICLARVKNAQMCPSCSKMCCMTCIKRWITEQRPECPHCRALLHMSQLVNCRFAADVSSELDKIRKKTQKAQAKELCTVHNAPLYYYCISCSSAICSDCAMFGEVHQGHKFEHLSTVYQRHVEMVRAEAVALRKRLKDLTSLMRQVEGNIETVTKAKEERAAELNAAVEQMQIRLDATLKNKLLTLLSYKGALVEEIEHQSGMLHELNRQLAFSPKSTFITKSESLAKSLQELHRRPPNHGVPSPYPIAADFVSEIVPPFASGSFTMRDFNKLRAAGTVVYSSGLDTCGLTWRLKVYPNGNGVARSQYLSVFLEMTHGLANPAKYDYRLELLNQRHSHICVTREFASDFEVGECWGYNRFFRIENLVKDGYLIPEDDVIVLRFYVRPQTYYQYCKDLKSYVEQLEAAHAQDTLLISDMRRRADRRDPPLNTSTVQTAADHAMREPETMEPDAQISEPLAAVHLDDLTDNNAALETPSSGASAASPNMDPESDPSPYESHPISAPERATEWWSSNGRDPWGLSLPGNDDGSFASIGRDVEDEIDGANDGSNMPSNLSNYELSSLEYGSNWISPDGAGSSFSDTADYEKRSGLNESTEDEEGDEDDDDDIDDNDEDDEEVNLLRS